MPNKDVKSKKEEELHFAQMKIDSLKKKLAESKAETEKYRDKVRKLKQLVKDV